MLGERGEDGQKKEEIKEIDSKEELKEESKAHQEEEGYYCNGLWCLVKKEPCFMCAMGLLHSRIEKVFIIEIGEDGPFTEGSLHCNPCLNHHFPVWLV